MASIRAFRDQSANGIAAFVKPMLASWNALEPGPRRLLQIGAALLVAGFLVAFVWLPAVRARDALTARLPQLEALLGEMRVEAKVLKALVSQPVGPSATRIVADVVSLQTIFGPDARVTAETDGFRIAIAAIEYARWWDKTNEALARHSLVLRTATLTRPDGEKSVGTLVAVEMLLGFDAPASGAVPSRQNK